MKLPDLSHEIQLWQQGYTIIGIDEVGRGAFAGPVYVAGVIFEPTDNDVRIAKLLSHGINDSKKLTAKKREELAKIIIDECMHYHISSIDVSIINKIGIGKAAFKAMRDVVKNLTFKASFTVDSSKFANAKQTVNSEPTNHLRPFILVDGFNIKYLRGIGLTNQRAIIGGDGISLSIAAASIIAKVARDEHMVKLANDHPSYFWAKNKGYGTAAHRKVISELGICPHHRQAFVKNFVKW